MNQEKISAKQLFAMILLFEFGTALVIPIGFSAEQGVWLAILFALIGGVFLFLVYDYFVRAYPGLPLSGYAQKILGKPIGWALALVYIPFFIYIAARDLREAGDLLATSEYDLTPLFILNALMVVAIVYVVRKGIEVLARMAELYLIVLVILGVLGNAFVIFSGLIDLKNLSPILDNGWKPILTAAYPDIFIFPFGEMICFTVILPYLHQQRQKARKTGVLALVVSGFILSLTHAVEISVLGSDLYSRSTFPLFVTISKVNIANFLQRLDAIVILSLIIANFFKTAIYCYAAMVLTADLFKLEKPQRIGLPIGIIVLLMSLMIASNLTEHFEEGRFIITYIFPVFSVAIPLFLLVVDVIRKRFGHKPSKASVEK
ncbi:GerAB/ArcD/ProY family transporter [Halalkalibacterium ligniniphilum]|uniref:GerAB/ArcD/ProY family transporter n=2 Tax=Halalkalibacterium ligniniphilum TaxID=1134413 RepID=UPI000347681A|nr:GerAB/ArcD/ProY family transporter [Halalkalibacterium ligniniphilum]